jgi:hypothetical protein
MKFGVRRWVFTPMVGNFILKTEMNNNTTWIEVLLSLGFGLVLLMIVGVILAISNPKIEANCAAKGGQILHRPGHLNSCIYPAK